MMEDDIMKGMDQAACGIISMPISGQIGVIESELVNAEDSSFLQGGQGDFDQEVVFGNAPNEFTGHEPQFLPQISKVPESNPNNETFIDDAEALLYGINSQSFKRNNSINANDGSGNQQLY